MRSTGVKAAALLLCLAAGSACSVRLASPYDEEISRRAAKLHDEVVAFELAMRRQAGTAAGDPRNEANQRRFDEWRASIATMTTLSAAADPRVVRCQDILARLPSDAAADPAIAQAVREAGEPPAAPGGTGAGGGDCQTLGIVRLGQRIDQLWGLYERNCQVPIAAAALAGARRPAAGRGTPPPAAAATGVPGVSGDCAALWTPSPAAAALGLSGPHGFGIDPVLRSIRAVIAAQEGKRASTN